MAFLYRRLQDLIWQRARLRLNVSKIRVWNAAGVLPDAVPQLAPESVVWVGDPALSPEQRGLVAFGVLFGSPAFMNRSSTPHVDGNVLHSGLSTRSASAPSIASLIPPLPSCWTRRQAPSLRVFSRQGLLLLNSHLHFRTSECCCCSASGSLPLTATYRRCRRRHDELGDHLAACPRSGGSRARGAPVERAAARVCREAGATVATNVLVRDLHVAPCRQNDRRIAAATSSCWA